MRNVIIFKKQIENEGERPVYTGYKYKTLYK